MNKRLITIILTVSVALVILVLLTVGADRIFFENIQPETTLKPEPRWVDSTFFSEITTRSPDTTVAEVTTEVITEPPVTTVEITTTAETLPPPKPDIIVSFAACGDNIIYRPAIWEAADRSQIDGKKYDFRPIYKNVYPIISAADIAFINQETVIAGESYGYTGYPHFNSPCDIADDLCSIGFDIVNLANNHMLDMWEKGLENTIDYWNSKDIITVGAYRNQEDASKIRIIERYGVKIALLSYTYSANTRVQHEGEPVVVPFYKKQRTDEHFTTAVYAEKIQQEVSRAKEQADVVLVSMHWGYEDTQKVNEEQRFLASLLCDAGADIILGHHPHVLQPIEYIQSSDKSRTALCIFSLGNFLAMQGNDYHALGGIFTFDIRVGENGVSTENLLFIPTVTFFNYNFRDNEIFLLSDFTEEMCKNHCVVSRGNNGTFSGYMTLASLRYYLNNVIDNSYLPEQFRVPKNN